MKAEDWIQLAALGVVLYLLVKKSQANTPNPSGTPVPLPYNFGLPIDQATDPNWGE